MKDIARGKTFNIYTLIIIDKLVFKKLIDICRVPTVDSLYSYHLLIWLDALIHHYLLEFTRLRVKVD